MLPADSPALTALLLISRARASANAALDQALSRVGLWLDDLALLQALADGPLPRARLASALSASVSETVRRVKPMEKLSWVTRTDDGSIALTDVGRSLLDEALGLAANRSETWLADYLDQKEIETLNSLLGRLVP